jgi:hypothetical protein
MGAELGAQINRSFFDVLGIFLLWTKNGQMDAG